jgi:N-acetylglucosaminyldiphosphoundecaprenol N-acetyl-beta-D-mannosaminyltransferase
MNKQVTILGLPFFNGSVQEAMERMAEGGLIVVPSGPGLAWDLVTNAAYRRAVTTADTAITDSGIMVMLWNVMNFWSAGNRIKRISGLQLLEHLLVRGQVRAKGCSLWVMPSSGEMEHNLNWLRANGFDHLSADDCVVAPFYERSADGTIEDEVLLRRIEERRPAWVFLNVGSGVQEPLGYWLRERLSYRPALLCTGAAIAFITGGQARIPTWADRLCLGWLFRVIHDPQKFLPRYVQALHIVPLMIRWQHALPPMRDS